MTVIPSDLSFIKCLPTGFVYAVLLIVLFELWRAVVGVRVGQERGGSQFNLPPKSISPRAQELCESGGGRPGLPSPISLTVSVHVKQH